MKAFLVLQLYEGEAETKAAPVSLYRCKTCRQELPRDDFERIEFHAYVEATRGDGMEVIAECLTCQYEREHREFPMRMMTDSFDHAIARTRWKP